MDNIDKKVISINYPCIQDIIIRKNETDVCFTTSDGQDETKLFLKDGQEIMFTVNFGDVSNIGFGGTDNWGKDRLPLYVNYTKGSVDYDSVFVDTIEIQKLAGDGDWCKCELINNNKNVKYTALSENPYNVTRTAYFYHKTNDDTVKVGDNAGRPASKEWCVTIIQDANPNGKPVVAECNGETVGNNIAVSDTISTTKVAIGSWSKNADCTESWNVDKSRNVTGECFIDLDSVVFNSDGKIYGAVGGNNPTTNSRSCKIPTKIGSFEDYFTVYQKPSTPSPTPDTGSTDLGELKYKVGLISDLHVCDDNDYKSISTSDDWWDEDDFKRAMDLLADDDDVKFIASCGDIMECGSPAENTPQDDYNDFYEIYNVPYWQVAGLRLFTCTGNHDFYGMFESRDGDVVFPDRFTNYNSISGRNQGVLNRIGQISIGGQGINGIVPARGRIVFDAPDGKEHTTGQGDMCFLAYNAYVEMYQDAAGYTKPIAPSENRLSDEAINAMSNYVYNNWDECKDSLSGFYDGYIGMRNGYSKLNYWLKKDNDIFIFLSLDYGEDVWEINNKWHDRMIHARTIIDLNANDPYIRRMKEYVADTDYSKADEAYNYQYYSPNSLIWLKEIIENNKDKKVFVFTHHFMPSRVGNGVGMAKDGNWFYSVISPDGVKDDREGSITYNKGSNALTGIEYWFINKLMNIYKNVVWFNGHSHISYSANANFDNHEYPIVSPSEKNEYVYTKSSLTPTKESAWCVSLPSTSKPRGIENGQSVRHYEDAEMGIMEIYEKGIKIKGYKIKENNKDVNKLLAEKSIKLI